MCVWYIGTPTSTMIFFLAVLNIIVPFFPLVNFFISTSIYLISTNFNLKFQFLSILTNFNLLLPISINLFQNYLYSFTYTLNNFNLLFQNYSYYSLTSSKKALVAIGRALYILANSQYKLVN